MKQFKTCVDFKLFVICILVGVSAAIFGYGQGVPNGQLSKHGTNVPSCYEIHGTVMDSTPDLSDANIAKLEHAFTNSNIKQILSVSNEIGLGSVSLSNVVVRLRGDSVNGVVNFQQPSWRDNYEEILERMLKEWAKPDSDSISSSGSMIKKKVVTDSRGNFEFIDLQAGVYQISAEAPARISGTGIQRMATGRIIVVPASSHARQLKINAYAITVKGRIIDADGKPVTGAIVIGSPVPFYKPYDSASRYEYAYQRRISTVSKQDGTYELQGFIPPNVLEVAYYLGGCDPATEDGRNTCYFYVEIHVKADGFVQDKKNVPRVPLVTEELLGPARRLLNAISQMAVKNGGAELQEKKDLHLPSSTSNTITGINIVLKKTDEAKQ